MFRQLLVPIDGSAAAWSCVPVAARMAGAVGGGVRLVTVVARTEDVRHADAGLEQGIDRCGPLTVRPDRDVLIDDSMVQAVAGLVESSPGSTLMTSSHGHRRLGAVLGGSTDELLRRTFGPIIVVGPRCLPTAGALNGTYVVPLDGSPPSDSVLPIVAAWTIEFGGTPWLVEVIDDPGLTTADVVESAFVSRRAIELRHRIARDVQHEALHGAHPARSIVEFADDERASMIFLSTRGRTRAARLRARSVATEIVHRATCPVVLFRPHRTHASVERTRAAAHAVRAAPPEWSRAWCEQVAASESWALPATLRRTVGRR